jgi:hypothetical protein
VAKPHEVESLVVSLVGFNGVYIKLFFSMIDVIKGLADNSWRLSFVEIYATIFARLICCTADLSLSTLL